MSQIIDGLRQLKRWTHAGGGGDSSFFGETCIPQEHATDEWTKLVEFIGYVDDRRLCLQNVIVVRKTA